MNKNFSNLALLPLADLPAEAPPASFLLLRLGRNDFTVSGIKSKGIIRHYLYDLKIE